MSVMDKLINAMKISDDPYDDEEPSAGRIFVRVFSVLTVLILIAGVIAFMYGTTVGRRLRASMGSNNVLRLYGVPAGEHIAIRIWYQEPVLWTVSACVSLAGFVLLAVLLIGKRKRA